MARFDLDLNLEAAFLDLDEIDRVLAQQVQAELHSTATRYLHRATTITPVGRPRRGRKPLMTGWSIRRPGPFRFHVVNVRPHAHLVEFGFSHVSGRQVPGTTRFIPLAQTLRADLVRQLTRVVGPDFGGRLRALEVTW